MTGFLIGAAVMLLLATAMVLWRPDPAPRSADATDPNLGWYRQRRRELHGDSAVLMDEARLRLVEDGAVDAGAAPEPSMQRGRFPTPLLVLGIVVFSVMIYWSTGAIEDVLIYEELTAITPEDGDAARAALLQRIATRSAERRDNLQYLSLLGRLYMADEDYAAASESFGLLAEGAPEDPQALALAAQARFLAADRQLDAQAQLLAERALAVDPQQPTALGLLGMASFENAAYAAAVDYWERLQALEQPGSPGFDMLRDVIAVARERGGIDPVEAGSADTNPVIAGNEPGISIALSLASDLAADPDAVIFVFARRAESAGGMPVAVRRLQARELPITLRLGDADTMAGQRLSEVGDVRVTAQLSANGQPGDANALYVGVAGPVQAGGSDAEVAIELAVPPTRG